MEMNSLNRKRPEHVGRNICILVSCFTGLLFFELPAFSILESFNSKIAQSVNSFNIAHAAWQGDSQVRVPAVAGTFYPSGGKELRALVRACLKTADGIGVDGKIRGLVAPHAGYVYSGIVAAAVYKQIDADIKTVIIIAPSHYVAFQGASIPEVSAYRTPLGDISLARIVSGLRKEPGFTFVADAHIAEHSLEVQLPFLQEVLGEFDLVPIVVGNIDPKMLAHAILPYIKEDTLVVASSDLSHYYSYDKAIEKDSICTMAIPSLDFDRMDACEACGKIPVLCLMHIAQANGWSGALIDYKNSGDTGGPKNRVVGYAGIAFTGGLKMSDNKRDIPAAQRKFLLELARSTITAEIKNRELPQYSKKIPPGLAEERGTFVTLHIENRLRGCIGSILPVEPVYESVRKNALNSAFRDPRFSPLTANELDKVHIEISVLTRPKRLSFTDGEDLKRRLKPNMHGVILSHHGNSSTFLPQVWEQLPDKEEFLEHLCLKGRMDKSCWKNPETKVEVYEAEVFSE
jgi:hypothetical protein